MELSTLNDYIGHGRVLTVYRGSIAHGTFIPPEKEMSTDDIDLMTIVIPNSKYYIGLESWGSRGTIEVKKDSWDIVAYEFRKFLALLEQGNPNVLSTLWVSNQHVLEIRQAGEVIRRNRDLFVGKHVARTFGGYAYAQLQKMTQGEPSGRGYMGARRKELRLKFGYDTKNAAHLIRLLRMGIEFLNTGVLNVNRVNIDAMELIEIKQGKYTLEHINSLAKDLFEKMREAERNSVLPERPNHLKISALCEELIWEELS